MSTTPSQLDKILVLDFGSQVSQLIARRVREANVYCELHPHDMGMDAIREFAPKGIVLSGGPKSVNDGEYLVDEAIFSLGVPVLGICYGMQLMAKMLGGEVERGDQGEFGHAVVKAGSYFLTDGLCGEDGSMDVWMSHGDRVSRPPEGFGITGSSGGCEVAMFHDPQRRFHGLQFHPEVNDTPMGKEMIRRFVVEECGCEPSWTMPNYIETAIAKIREMTDGEEVVLGLSGGVDSSVAAALIHRAIGDKLTCVFVDHGLLRLREAELVMESFRDHLGVKVVHVDASERFMKRLEGVSDPEAKRKIIGAEFVEVFKEEAAKLTDAKWLAQGTIYPDVIESAGAKTGKAQAIKSHHNVGGLPEDLHLKLLEPLRDLFKDEVRVLGETLGLPSAMIRRHPFPGPGLGVRILGPVDRKKADMLRLADDIFMKELMAAVDEDGKSWYEKTGQAFAVFVPQKTVGVMGDGRTYDYLVALRAVNTTDFMTASWARLPYDLLAKVSNRIINEVKGVNRVVYDISGKPPATIEWE